MKKIIISFLALVFSISLMSQVTYGPRIGLNISKYAYNFDDPGLEPDVKFRLGGSVGGVLNLQFNSFLAFQPALSITKKGTAYDIGSDESGSSILEGYSRSRVAYLEVPLNLAIGVRVGTGQLQLFAGPYLAFAFCGKNRWDYEVNVDGIREQVDDSQKIRFRNEVSEEDAEEDVAYQRPFDLGIDLGLGYKYKQLLFNIGFAMGFANLQPEYSGSEQDAADFKYSNRTVFLTAAWLFGGE